MTDNAKSSILVSEIIGSVSLLTRKPKNPEAVLVMAHGAGAGMDHPFMESLAAELANRGIATVRYNFPYLEKKKKRPDPAPVAEKTVAMVIQSTHETFPETPLFAGGKSFGGRMTSQRLSKECPAFVRGIVFFGFPLHPVGAPSVERAAHLQSVHIPMLFLQGTRDNMADVELLNKTCSGLATATLATLEGADHSFQSGKKKFISELADETVAWIKNQKKQYQKFI